MNKKLTLMGLNVNDWNWCNVSKNFFNWDLLHPRLRGMELQEKDAQKD